MIDGSNLIPAPMMNGSGAPEYRIAIVGGGPGGLFTAWHLSAKAGAACKITIYEASDRLGGKIVTGQFPGVGPYEAGAAEIYDYTGLGYDPLRELIENELGLSIKHIAGGACVLDGHILQNIDALATKFNVKTRDIARAFRQRCAQMVNPGVYYRSDIASDNRHPWANVRADEMLTAEIKDEVARRYIRVMAHSDVAAPPHQTSGLNFVKNVLMDVNGYLSVYSVLGGNEQIVERLEDEIEADVRLNANVRSIEPLRDGTYRLEVMTAGVSEFVEADYVVLALPLTALSMIEWRSPTLRRAMDKQIAYFDRPGHYLRATLLFERPFWREHIAGDWFMVDSFDGCCVYDESARNDLGAHGALGFLIAGNAALALANMPDERIEALCLDALPPVMQYGRDLVVDRRIHRWMATVNAIPGGIPERSRFEDHQPDRTRLPGLFTVGDYMFDATLNGVLDSADSASDMILSDLLLRRRALAQQHAGVGAFNGTSLGGAAGSDNELIRRAFDAPLLADLMSAAYGTRRGAKVLCVGVGAAATADALRGLGYEAWSVALTAQRDGAHDVVSDLTELAFGDGYFDVVIERGLCLLPRAQAVSAIGELRRVVRRGIILGSVTTDLAIDLIERFDLLAGVKTLTSRWDWSDMMFGHGLDHALADPARLARAWSRAEEAGAGPGHWYEDPTSLSYSIYQVVDRPAELPAERPEPAAALLRPRIEIGSHGDDRTPIFASTSAVAS